jgi:hypothetical protein
MRCLSCDKGLTDFEATRKYTGTPNFVDLCNKCFSYVHDVMDVTENYSLLTTDDINELEDYDYDQD